MPTDSDLRVPVVTNTERRNHALLLPGYIQVGDLAVGVKGLLDSGADAVIINRKVVEKHNLPTVKLPRTLTFRNADDTVNKAGTVTHRVEGDFVLGNKKLPTHLYVSDIGREDVILGIPWIRKYNPSIDWDSGRITISQERIKQQRRIHTYRQTHEPPPGTLWGLPLVSENQDIILSYTTVENDDSDDEESLRYDPSEVLERLAETYRLQRINKSTEIAVAANKDVKKRTLEEILPEFLKDYQAVFEKKAAERFPPSRQWDHAIDFIPNFDFHKKDTWGKVYSLTTVEKDELQKFIDENLAKGYIRPSTSPLASPFFFITKKDGSLRLVQDYRALNDGTIKN